jgi:mono/diheme cytochrome c family protein
MMPPFSWLFSGSPDRPTQEALDVLAYMDSLGRSRQLSGFERQALGSGVRTETSDMAMAGEPSARATPPTVPIAMTGGYSLSAPVLHPASDPDDLQEEVSRGGALFAANCASCHGSAGVGDGKASASLLPKPANLTAARFSDERLSSVLWNGVAGSSMPPWRQLPTEDLRALVAYIHSLHPPSAVPSTQEETSLDEGKSLFAANCASCHGDRGAGNGPVAGALAPAPTNFQLKKPTQERVREVLENGLPGTAMPPWTSQLSADQRHALVGFVRSLYGPQQEDRGQ